MNLLPLIVNRVFGEWNIGPQPSDGASGGDGGLKSPVTSPGGSRYSSPSAVSPSGAASALTLTERDYRHAEGGWLGLYSSPVSSQQQQQQSNGGNHGSGLNHRSATSNNSTTRSSSTSLDHDPITRLLRAPRNQHSRSSSNNNNSENTTTYYPPTLLDALSIESQQRPHIKFKFPLGGLSACGQTKCVEDWKVCFWKELERKEGMNNVNGAQNGGRGGFGMQQGAASTASKHDGLQTKEDGTTASIATTKGVVCKENATRIIQALLSGGLAEQLELHTYFTQLYHQQQNSIIKCISKGSNSHCNHRWEWVCFTFEITCNESRYTHHYNPNLFHPNHSIITPRNKRTINNDGILPLSLPALSSRQHYVVSTIGGCVTSSTSIWKVIIESLWSTCIFVFVDKLYELLFESWE